jgi:hypothetical protein
MHIKEGEYMMGMDWNLFKGHVIGLEEDLFTLETLRLLDKAKLYFRRLNETLYHGEELPDTDVVVNINLHDAQAEYWRDTENKPIICLNIYDIDGEDGLKEIIAHEMVHEYCEIHHIKDIEPRTGHHTEEYRQAAEAHGLKCEYEDNMSGWSITTLTETAKDLLVEDWRGF